MTKSKLSTSLTLTVEITYQVLPEADGFPLQVDVVGAHINVVGGKGKKARKVQLLETLSEEEILQIEDEILERLCD